jgi:hypothetical protein
MNKSDHQDFMKVVEVLTRLARTNRELAGHLRIMTAVMEEQQNLIEKAQTQIDDMKMRLAVLEAAREKGR